MANNTAKKPVIEDWHPADILAALHKLGITLVELSRRHNIRGSSTLSKAMNQTAYPLNEKRIADALKKKPEEIWPTRYNADGTRKSFSLRAMKSTAAAPACNVNRTDSVGGRHETRRAA